MVFSPTSTKLQALHIVLSKVCVVEGNHIYFHPWKAIDNCWNRKMYSVCSPVINVARLPIPWTSSTGRHYSSLSVGRSWCWTEAITMSLRSGRHAPMFLAMMESLQLASAANVSLPLTWPLKPGSASKRWRPFLALICHTLCCTCCTAAVVCGLWRCISVIWVCISVTSSLLRCTTRSG